MQVKVFSKRLPVEPIISVLICLSIALWATHVVLQKKQWTALKNYSDYALNYASGVTADLKTGVVSAQSSPYTACSHNDLELLRDLLWQHKYLKDIGHVQNGNLICSAERGVLKEAVALPPADAVLNNGVSFWRNSSALIRTHFEMDMTLTGSVLAITSPFAFDAIRYPDPTVSAIIYSKNNRYVFKTFGFNQQRDLAPSAKMTSAPLSYASCSEVNVCVMGERDRAGIFSLSFSQLLILVFASCLSGFGLYSLVHKARKHRHSMVYHLKNAITKDEFSIVFQPKIRLSDSMPVGVEALVRWDSHALGVVRPDVFIEVAEKYGLIRKITHRVIDLSMAQMQTTLDAKPDFTLSINLSIQDLTDLSLLPFILAKAKQYKIQHEQLVFEITERSAGDSVSLSDIVKQYTEADISISLDDFGTGYSNLAWLGHLNASEIKVDKSFTQSIGTDSINQTMLDAIFSLLQRLNVVRVFEGVETQEQADYILKYCPQAIVQGWLYAKPMPIDQLQSYLSQTTNGLGR